MKLLVKMHNGRLIPMFDSDAEKLKRCKFKEGEVYEGEFKQPRNIMFHRKYFALMNLCFENQEHFDNIDDLRDYITCKSGFYKKVVTPNGGEMIKPDSISFASIDEASFSELYDKTLNQVSLLIGTEKEDLINELINFY